AQVVREKDYFKFSRGLNPELEHIESEDEDRGGITHVYAVANFSNGGFAFDVWPIAKVMAHAKKFSKSFTIKNYRTGEESINAKSPWATDFEAMAKKTLIMAIWKYLPLSTELLLAQAQDGSVKNDAAGLSKIQDEKDVVLLQAVSTAINDTAENGENAAAADADYSTMDETGTEVVPGGGKTGDDAREPESGKAEE
ncbi:MAG: recombinase RecT, partial [Synergistaceae bacterium]|nr:recombinase RecT [Synergistaceae bacterium]